MYVHEVNKHTRRQASKQTINHKTDMISVLQAGTGWNLWMCRHLLVGMWHNLPSMRIKTCVSLGGVASKQHFTGLLLTQCKSLLVLHCCSPCSSSVIILGASVLCSRTVRCCFAATRWWNCGTDSFLQRTTIWGPWLCRTSYALNRCFNYAPLMQSVPTVCRWVDHWSIELWVLSWDKY